MKIPSNLKKIETWVKLFIFIFPIIAFLFLDKELKIKEWINPFLIGFAVVAVLSILIPQITKYLDDGRTTQADIENDINEYRFKIEKELKGLKEDLITSEISKVGATENIDLDRIISLLKIKTEEITKASVDHILDENYTKTYLVSKNLSRMSDQIDALQVGVNLQINRLSRGSTLNLIIGLIASSIAISILGFLALNSSNIDQSKYFYIVAPRITLALFIEVISFFFLNLYKRNLSDIKYFQNERTNIDSKAIALRAAIFSENDASLNKVIVEYSKVERNYVLKKGESTILLERDKLEIKAETDLIDGINKLAETIKKKDV